MYFSVNIVIFLVICNYGVVRGANEPCPTDANALGDCKCYPLSRQIRCEGLAITSIKQLTALKGQWEYLFINNTKIETLVQNTFEHAEFKQIFISENNLLKTIDKAAFGPLTPKITEVLEIRENILLTESGLYEIAKSLASSLITIGFDGNHFDTFNGLKIDNTFTKLVSLNLNNQQGGNALNLPADFISSPPLLHQLSLDYNRIATIPTSIDLTSTNNPANKRISIFLNNNALLPTSLDLTSIKLPSDKTIAVGLDVENNQITELTEKNVLLFEAIAKSGTPPNLGNVYLKGNTIAKCDCTSAKPLRKPGVWERFPELIGVDCGANGKLASCAAT